MFKKILSLVCVALISVSIHAQTIYSLNSSNINWKICRVDQAVNSIANLSKTDFNVDNWIDATVPGTFFVDHVNAGLESNPDFGDNIYQIDEAKYNKPFWYRAEFEVPEGFTNEKLFLHFKGVNKEGIFYLNGRNLGVVKGFMLRSKFDITDKVQAGKNVLLVKVSLPDVRKTRESAGMFDIWSNFAMPTFMSSASWDWMPYVPGLNCGIINDVYLETTGFVALEDSWVRTALPRKNKAELSIQTTLKNNGSEQVTGVLKATIMPGNIQISKNITLDANSSTDIILDKNEFSQLSIDNPSLWWPNGYGEQNLYVCTLEFNVADSKLSDQKKVNFGIKKYDYRKENGAFTLYINDAKVLMRGGNWGMTEYLQRSRGEEYDTRIKLHADMNFNMIRCWTGCVTDDEFYDYCDKYGIMVWDDFWFHGGLFTPDEKVFMDNAVDKIKRLRNHPSIAVWCGANEGVPGADFDSLLRAAVAEYDGNDRHYQSSSNAGGGLSGSGWWTNMHPRTYFSGPGSGGGDWNGAGTWALRTEIGTATFTTFESFQEFMPVKDWWPPKNEMWNKHYFGNQAQTAGTDNYFNTVENNYGTSKEIDEFCEKSQYLNLETMKAIFEGWNHNMWNNATGVLIWMSQSAYPSFVWQTYDYYYDATGAYWGAKKACEPLHIQWSYADNSVKVINTTLNNYTNLKAKATVYNLQGRVYEPLSRELLINSNSNTATECFVLLESYSGSNLAINKPVFASANTNDGEGVPERAVDGDMSSRWGSGYQNDAWFCVDLEDEYEINKVKISWETAYGKKFLIQVSNNAQDWTTVYTQNDGKGKEELITFNPVTARYVKFQGVERATMWGYSFYEFEVFETGGNGENETGNVQLTDLNFIRLELFDNEDKLVSDNFYWRNMNSHNYQSLNSLPLADVSLTQTTTHKEGKYHINCVVTNHSSTVAFGNRLKVTNKNTGKRVLPIYMNDNYFTLLPNESKNIQIEFDESLVENNNFVAELKQYGDYNSTPVNSVDPENYVTEKILLSPNPVSDKLIIHNSFFDIQNIKIFDLQGKQVYSGESTNQIDVSNLVKGMYILQVMMNDHTYTQKFQKVE